MESGAAIMVAELMRASAVTAPKAAGQDYIKVKICTPMEMGLVAKEMLVIGKEKGIPNWERDAKGIEKSEGLVFIGVKEHKGMGLN